MKVFKIGNSYVDLDMVSMIKYEDYINSYLNAYLSIAVGSNVLEIMFYRGKDSINPAIAEIAEGRNSHSDTLSDAFMKLVKGDANIVYNSIIDAWKEREKYWNVA